MSNGDTKDRSGRAAGRVVILNGTSSSGKSTLATRFRDERAVAGEPWVVIGIDDYLAKLPIEWFAGDGHVGPQSTDGVRFEPSGDGVEVKLGDFGRRLLGAYHRAVAACASSGIDVIVDEVALDRQLVDDWSQALAGLDVIWVAVRCDVGVAEARERERGDRMIGLVRGQDAVVHRWVRYQGDVHTTQASVAESVAELNAIVDASRDG